MGMVSAGSFIAKLNYYYYALLISCGITDFALNRTARKEANKDAKQKFK